jgi:phage gpG-like protein
MSKGVKVIDRGLKRIIGTVNALKKAPVAAVGIIENKTDRSGDELTNAQIGTFHEFGTGNMPERSFLRSTIVENQSKINEMLRKADQQMIEGKLSPEIAVGRVGATVATWVKKKILSNIPPRTKPEGGIMLVDTGQLVGSISWDLRKDKK